MVSITDSYVELNTFLRIKGFALTGGQAKIVIRSGDVLVNKVVETRNKKKLVDGDVVTYKNVDYVVNVTQLRNNNL